MFSSKCLLDNKRYHHKIQKENNPSRRTEQSKLPTYLKVSRNVGHSGKRFKYLLTQYLQTVGARQKQDSQKAVLTRAGYDVLNSFNLIQAEETHHKTIPQNLETAFPINMKHTRYKYTEKQRI